MLTKYLTIILLVLPALTYAGVVIKIEPAQNGNEISVNFLSEDIAVINDKERELFKLDDETLKRATEKIMGKRCSHVFVKPPTPWGDVHKKYDWDPVRRHIEPMEVKIIGVDTKPVAIDSAEYVNSLNSLDVT